jgi:hypothetical protein
LDTTAAGSLHSWSSRATPEDLHEGPRAADLGGWEAVAAVADGLASNPYFVYLIDIAGKADGTAAGDILTELDQAVLRGVAEHTRHSSYVSAITRLLTYPSLIARLGRPLEHALQRRSEAGANPGADVSTAATGATALQAWLHLCTSTTFKEHRILAFLTDLPDAVGDLPSPMARALPRIAGLAHEHFGDDDLIALLHQLADIPEAEADAGFELALADLRRALSAGSQSAFMQSAAQARSGFAAVEAADEARHDAHAYGAALDAIIAFGRTDPAALRDATSRLEAAVSQHSAWLSGNYVPTWTWTRTQAEVSWLQLSAVLASAADTLHEICWYHPSQAVAALLDAYKAARSFTSSAVSSAPTGVELLILPAIEGAFVRDAYRLALLDRALAHDPAFSGDVAAQQLHAAVHTALSSTPTAGHPPSLPAEGDDGLGKELSRLTAVLHLLGPTAAADLAAEVPLPLLERLDAALWNNEVARSATGGIKADRKLRWLVQELEGSPDWPIAGGPFTILLQQTILYLVSRYDIGAAMGGARTAFLRNPEPGSVLERELQQDYYDWLSQGPLYGAVAAEVSDRSHGRVDILVRIGNVSFSVECKRELKDASAGGLRAYLGQAAVYTNTSAALGILLVLDLTTPQTGAPDLFSSIWVEQVQREREKEPRHIVVARLPGNAPAPSATRTPAVPALGIRHWRPGLKGKTSARSRPSKRPMDRRGRVPNPSGPGTRPISSVGKFSRQALGIRRHLRCPSRRG